MTEAGSRASETVATGCVELDVVLALAGEDTQRTAELLDRTSIDWDRVVDLATMHQLRPLLYRRLAGLGDRVPPLVVRRLRFEFARTSTRAHNYADTVVALHELLGTAGVQATPFKGPVLALDLYGSVAMREFHDIDMLVRPEDVDAALDALAAEGYESREATSRRRDHKHLSGYGLTSADGETLVGIQWNVSRIPYFKVPLDGDLWARRQTIDLPGGRVPDLALVDKLHVLSVHAARHHWDRWQWIADIAPLAGRSSEADLGDALDLAARHGNRRMVLMGFELARRLFGVGLPGNITAAARGDRVVSDLCDDVIAAGTGVAGEPSQLATHRYRLAVRERWQDKARYLPWLASRIITGER